MHEPVYSLTRMHELTMSHGAYRALRSCAPASPVLSRRIVQHCIRTSPHRERGRAVLVQVQCAMAIATCGAAGVAARGAVRTSVRAGNALKDPQTRSPTAFLTHTHTHSPSSKLRHERLHFAPRGLRGLDGAARAGRAFSRISGHGPRRHQERCGPPEPSELAASHARRATPLHVHVVAALLDLATARRRPARRTKATKALARRP